MNERISEANSASMHEIHNPSGTAVLPSPSEAPTVEIPNLREVAPTMTMPTVEMDTTGGFEAPDAAGETPMGPTPFLVRSGTGLDLSGGAIAPIIPMDTVHEEVSPGTEQGRWARLMGKVGEKVGDATAFVDYIGNVALIETAYHAGEAAAFTREKVEDTAYVVASKARQAADAAGDFTRKIDDTGNAVLEGAALGAGIAASVIDDKAGKIASKTGEFTRKTDETGRAALERMAPAVDKGAELAGTTTRKTDYIGRVLLERMAAYGNFVSTSVKRRMGHPSTWSEEQFKDWRENWDWKE